MRLICLKNLSTWFILILLTVFSLNSFAAEKKSTTANYKLKLLAEPVEAPDFLLMDMDGNSHSLKQYRGKVVLINFWATWCSPCIREMPSLQKLYDTFKYQSLIVLAINQWEDEDRVFEFMGQLDPAPTFPVLFDTDSKLSDRYRVQGLPSTYIINKQGKIVYRAKGGRDFDHPKIMHKIKALL